MFKEQYYRDKVLGIGTTSGVILLCRMVNRGVSKEEKDIVSLSPLKPSEIEQMMKIEEIQPLLPVKFPMDMRESLITNVALLELPPEEKEKKKK